MKQFSQTIVVDAGMTAEKIGSGLLPVFSTPSMIALMENTAMQMIELPAGASSVGTSIHAEHLKASKTGEEITCTAFLTEVDGRRCKFNLEVTDKSGQLVGKGTHERFVIDIDRFMARL